MKTIKKMQRAFKLYKKLKSRQQFFVNTRREGINGIAGSKDEYAVKWQAIEFRVHFLECYLSGQNINWYFARWITNTEADARNGWN